MVPSPILGAASPCQDVTKEDMNGYRYFVNELLTKVHKLEKQLNEVDQFYQSTDVQLNNSKGKDLEKHLTSTEKRLQCASSREITASKEMQELVHNPFKILHELSQVDMELKNLKTMVIGKCRKLSGREKRKLAHSLARLSMENLVRAIKIVSETDPTFESDDEVIDLDMDALSDYTLWKLNIFAKNALEVQGRTANAKRKRVS